ncbi:hypothetical protein AHiyo8_19730 [Arthrobacter sp. Hiyo8]|nr:hypothetical protein AHiyo8_19730 [Arthrobacter sp. Hiyo8]
MSSSPENEAADLLQGILDLQSVLVGAGNASDFLSGLTKLAAASISEASGDEIECAITVKVRRRPLTAAGSSPRAVQIDRFEQAIGDGPCIAALREMSPVIIDDGSTDLRWPALTKKFAEIGVHSSLGIPMEISEDASAALNFFASKPGAFTPDVFNKAVGFAAAARNILHLSVRIDSAHHRQRTWNQQCKAGPPSTWPAVSSWRKTDARRQKRWKSSPRSPATATANYGTSPPN